MVSFIFKPWDMANDLTLTQNELIKLAASENNFKKYNVVVSAGSTKGENYLGELKTVTIKDDSSDKRLYLILKSATTNEDVRKKGPIVEAFKREAYIYGTVLPRLCQLQEEKSVSQPFTGFAKYYGSRLENRNETILMQNLKKYDFQLWDRKTPMNQDHIEIVFKEYGRFHASSLALNRLYPEEFEKLTKDIQKNVFESANSNMSQKERQETFFNQYFKGGLLAVRDREKALKGLQKLKANIVDWSERSFRMGRQYFVVLHGDCWCNNMLFKYEPNSKRPSQVAFIDWQISKLGSPILDLSYFFSVCASKELFSNLGKYLTIYHRILSQNLREFGCDPEQVFSFEALMEEWKRNSWYGAFLAVMTIKLMLSDSEEAPDVGAGDSVLSSLTNFDMAKSTEFGTRLSDLVEFMVDNNYI